MPFDALRLELCGIIEVSQRPCAEIKWTHTPYLRRSPGNEDRLVKKQQDEGTTHRIHPLGCLEIRIQKPLQDVGFKKSGNIVVNLRTTAQKQMPQEYQLVAN